MIRERITHVANWEQCSHFGLSHEVMFPFPVKVEGDQQQTEKSGWLDHLENHQPAPDYRAFLQLWRDSFPAASVLTFELKQRLLTGAGMGSGSQVGLKVHHTWGVPILPGSGLKGLLAHYVDATIGDAQDPQRRDWCGPTWRNGRVECPPGRLYAELFGSPAFEVEGADPWSRSGQVQFHDALWDPDSAGGKPFVRDVLTVHQKDYYDNQGIGHRPNDWTSPNPVAFMTVRPGSRFLVPLTGDPGWVRIARHWLTDTLRDWGVGAKTSLGYGQATLAETP